MSTVDSGLFLRHQLRVPVEEGEAEVSKNGVSSGVIAERVTAETWREQWRTQRDENVRKDMH